MIIKLTVSTPNKEIDQESIDEKLCELTVKHEGEWSLSENEKFFIGQIEIDIKSLLASEKLTIQ